MDSMGYFLPGFQVSYNMNSHILDLIALRIHFLIEESGSILLKTLKSCRVSTDT